MQARQGKVFVKVVICGVFQDMIPCHSIPLVGLGEFVVYTVVFGKVNTLN